MIAIIDYGAGNLKSVKKAFDYLNIDAHVATDIEQLQSAERIVLPGVGAFGAAVNRLQESNFFDVIVEWIEADKPFLGICLGMQLLMESSSESSGVTGLSVLKGHCERFQTGKVPQIGWNCITNKKDSPLLHDIPDATYFYFLHGYYIVPEDTGCVAAVTDYGISYASIIERGNLRAVQFHPEKSGDKGLQLLKNWVELC
ncbi:MAG: imidazole glycerol phosphate synthase subunit HisH [candidate division KSB1 bacterium]|jgi:glutamine amidotransferase|nr:imidazole glycerol phosphate synthase subunit HisH [candidate division KSB1 bacterium]